MNRLATASILGLLSVATVRADEAPLTCITTVKSITATSTLAGKKVRYDPERIFDWRHQGDMEMPPELAWCEGKPDEGIGEAVTITFDAPVKVAELAIKAGFWRTPELFRANNIVTGIEVATDDGRKQNVTFPEKMEEVTVAIGGAPTKQLALKITKVKKGRMNDSCIANVVVRTEPESSIVLGMDPALAAAIPRVEKALASCDQKLLAAAVAFPFSWVPYHGEEESKKLSYKDASAMAAACKKDEGLTPRRSVPGVDFSQKAGVVYLEDGSCGDSCFHWGFAAKGGVWRLVWVGPTWIPPTPGQ